jgi:hypothetical protein
VRKGANNYFVPSFLLLCHLARLTFWLATSARTPTNEYATSVAANPSPDSRLTADR